ncbi:MAG: hypothetical protein QOG32_1438 [Chloroflexota bacterium]|nr:hypothetical protein [Chloroflexota bacterium]
MAAVALIAGADGMTAARLGVAMTALQASIGALNDAVDAARDAIAKPRKPIPSGIVSPASARVTVVVAAGLGIALSAPSGGPEVALALVVLTVGYGYDLRFKATAWSWLPFAVGIPILPVFGWLGVHGRLPSAFASLLPVAVVAGAALAIANARADANRDALSGVDSVAVRLGRGRSWWVNALLLAGVVLAAVATLVASGNGGPGSTALVGIGGAIVGVGVVVGRSVAGGRLERAWELEAIGLALMAAGWLAGVGLEG